MNCKNSSYIKIIFYGLVMAFYKVFSSSPPPETKLFGTYLMQPANRTGGLAIKLVPSIVPALSFICLACWISTLYASVPNYVLGQRLGCPAHVLTLLRSAHSAKRVKGEPLRLCFQLAWSSTSVEKAKNRPA